MQKILRVRCFVPVSFLATVLVLYAACAPGTTTGNIGGTPSTSGGQPTTIVKTKPTGPVKVDQALCDRLISKAEAGQITQTTVASIRVIATDEGGSCNYETAPFKAAVFVAFFPGGAAAVQAEQDRLKSEPDFKGTVTSIGGLGDSAIAIVNPLPGTSIIQYHISIAYGTLFIDCVLPKSAAGDTAAIAQLKQVAQLVLDRL